MKHTIQITAALETAFDGAGRFGLRIDAGLDTRLAPKVRAKAESLQRAACYKIAGYLFTEAASGRLDTTKMAICVGDTGVWIEEGQKFAPTDAEAATRALVRAATFVGLLIRAEDSRPARYKTFDRNGNAITVSIPE